MSVATKVGTIYFYSYAGEKPEWQSTYLFISETDNNKSKPRVNLQIFSNDSKHMATMSDDLTVCLFKIDHKYGDPVQPKEWVFSGKVRVHLLRINSIAFGESMNDKGEIKFFSY